jgi:hypothetical protein
MNADFRDMIGAFISHGVAFLVVGTHALAAHGRPSATGDLEIWVRPTQDNARRVWDALIEFGAPLGQLCPEDFATPDQVAQFGLPPGRIDLLTSLSGVRFEHAWAGREPVTVSGLTFNVLGREQLIRNKRATGRAKDGLDADELEGL